MAWICSFLQSQCVKSKKARLCHQKTIHEIEKKCEICGEVCIDQNILQIHKDNLHSNMNSKSQAYACDICEKTYASTTILKIHVTSIHNKVKQDEFHGLSLNQQKKRSSERERRFHEKKTNVASIRQKCHSLFVNPKLP